LSMLRRFFRSGAFLVSRAVEPDQQGSFLEQTKNAYHHQEMQSLPGKLGTWGKQIDHKAFPHSTPAQMAGMAASLQVLADRTEALIEAYRAPQAGRLVSELGDEVRAWRIVIEQGFQRWSEHLAGEPADVFRKRLLRRLARLDDRIEQALNKTEPGQISAEKARNFYRLLGAFRGVSEAAVGFAKFDNTIDCRQFREERF
jgi:hypothetical protein